MKLEPYQGNTVLISMQTAWSSAGSGSIIEFWSVDIHVLPSRSSHSQPPSPALDPFTDSRRRRRQQPCLQSLPYLLAISPSRTLSRARSSTAVDVTLPSTPQTLYFCLAQKLSSVLVVRRLFLQHFSIIGEKLRHHSQTLMLAWLPWLMPKTTFTRIQTWLYQQFPNPTVVSFPIYHRHFTRPNLHYTLPIQMMHLIRPIIHPISLLLLHPQFVLEITTVGQNIPVHWPTSPVCECARKGTTVYTLVLLFKEHRKVAGIVTMSMSLSWYDLSIQNLLSQSNFARRT